MSTKVFINLAEKLNFGVLKPTKIHIGDVKKLRLATNTVASNPTITRTTQGLNREDVLLRYVEKTNANIIRANRKISIEAVDNEFSRINSHLNSEEQEQLLRLVDEGHIKPYSKPGIFRSSDHVDSRHSPLCVSDELNLIFEEEETFAENIALFKELLKLEREGLLKSEHVGSFLTLKQIATDPENFRLFLDCYKKGQINKSYLRFAAIRCMEGNFTSRIRTTVNQVDKLTQQRFLTNFENIAHAFQNGRSVDELKAAGGIGLKYSRNTLCDNIKKQIKHLNPQEQEEILAKFGLTPNGSKAFAGLPIYSKNTEGFSNVEKAINEEINRFLNHNEIILPEGFEAYKAPLEEICATFPEFRYTIGMNQHGGHKHFLAEHMLKVFQETTKNPLYKTLNESDRRVLGISSMLHDICKTEGVDDVGHCLTSALTVESLIGKMNLSVGEQNRIINLIENHHWLSQISNTPECAQTYARIFKGGNDFTMAKILAEADLKGVNSTMFRKYRGKINSPVMEDIEREILSIQKNGRMLYTADVTTEAALAAGAQKITLGAGNEATENIIISAKALGLDQKTIAYHCGNLQCAYEGGRFGVEGVFSLSVGKLGQMKTRTGQEIFLIARRPDMDNIAFLRNANGSTGFGKDAEGAITLMKNNVEYAQGVRSRFTDLTAKTISEEQYAQLFREIPRDEITKIHTSPRIIEILGGEKEALAFEKAVAAQNETYNSARTYSEAVMDNLRWGAVGVKIDPQEISYSLRRFLQDNNITIVDCR